MEQQLKMVVMKSKFQNLPIRLNNDEKSERVSSRRKNSSLSKSFYTEERLRLNEKKRTIEEQDTKAVNTHRMRASALESDQAEGEER